MAYGLAIAIYIWQSLQKCVLVMRKRVKRTRCDNSNLFSSIKQTSCTHFPCWSQAAQLTQRDASSIMYGYGVNNRKPFQSESCWYNDQLSSVHKNRVFKLTLFFSIQKSWNSCIALWPAFAHNWSTRTRRDEMNPERFFYKWRSMVSTALSFQWAVKLCS